VSATLARIEHQEYLHRTRWTMSASLVAHALILLWIMLAPHVASQVPELTEITLIEPGELGGAPASSGAPSASAAPERAGVAVLHRVTESFRRLTKQDEVTPEPQSADAVADRITARLAAIHETSPAPVKGLSPSPLADAWGTPSAPAGAVGGGGTALSLNRGGGGTSIGPSLSLNRGGTGPSAAIVSTGLPSGGGQGGSAPARGGETTARRVAAGAMLAGPIADRPVIAYTRPVYPEWAKRDAVEGSVTLYFIVRPDGGIRENILVQKTAGFEDFDENARTALRQWRFAALREGRTGEQWGTITFHYRLREAG
jgi:TonB family protein